MQQIASVGALFQSISDGVALSSQIDGAAHLIIRRILLCQELLKFWSQPSTVLLNQPDGVASLVRKIEAAGGIVPNLRSDVICDR